MFRSKLLCLIVLSLILLGCATTEKVEVLPSIQVNHTLYQVEDTLDEPDVFRLSETQQQEFFTHYQGYIAQGMAAHEAVAKYIQLFVTDFTYYGETYTAQEAFKKKSGNCMSLAILTTALAKLVDVNFSFRLVNNRPVYEKHGKVILRSTHIRTYLHDPDYEKEEGYYYFNEPSIVIDYFPSKNHVNGEKINPSTFLAMFYQNLASDALLENDLNLAFNYIERAYNLIPKNASVLNSLAILHKRAGDYESAENIFKYALERSGDNLGLLHNYAAFLNGQGRYQEADIIKERKNAVYDPNPYNWISHALMAKADNDLKQVERYYKKAIRVAPYVTDSYLGLYQLYSEQGDHKDAEKILSKALKWTHETEKRQIYEYKINNASRLVTMLNQINN